MASNTENLNLLMKNPSTDGADTFNVQTMLNENWQKIDNNAGTVAQTLANILKPTTPPIIGLPPSTTPDGMFQALGNTGELHVWKKTVKTSSDTPAGYTLEAAQSNLHIPTSGQTVDFVYSASITVGNDGIVSQPSSGTKRAFATSVYVSDVQSVLAGKFFTVKNDYGSVIDGVWYCPPSLTVSVSGNDIILSQAQKVNAHGIIPAGTTTTYPVSTNPNAYQEGSDAKPAGYTLGDVVSGNFQFGNPYSSNTGFRMDASASVSVDDNGNVSLAAPITTKTINKTNVNTKAEIQQLMLGKYVIADKYTYPHSDDIPGGIVIYIPSDATINMDTDAGSWRLSKYQPVAGYTAIPAGTTIEYLGKLGDKARVQVVSYVGTGTSGSDNPVSITFDFVPKSIWVIGMGYNYESEIHLMHGDARKNSNKDYYFAFSQISWESKTVSWYNTRNDGYQASALQANTLGETYKVLAIG